MKFQEITTLALAIFGAAAAGSHVARRAHESHHRSHHSHPDHCPSGYIVSTYYTTVTVTTPSMPQPTTTIHLTSTVFVTDYLSASVAPYNPSSVNPYNQYGGNSNINNSSVSACRTKLPVYVPTSSVTPSSPSPSPSPSTSTSTSSSTSTSAQGAPSVPAKSSYTSSSLGGPYSGQATYYGGNMGGACSFSTYTLPSGIFGTALSSTNWDNSGNCGACISVTGPNGNTIQAMIVDECPSCGSKPENHLDLFKNAFSELAILSVGVINVNWSIVPCGITSPIILHNKDGASQYWFSMQVVNSNIPIASLEVCTDGVTWQSTTRVDYNFFEKSSGFGTTSVDVRVTSVTGSTIVVKGVPVSSDSSTTASSNFQA